ncbi:hypothetical protein EG328_004012 [Venturia inaequalis]|uniref:DUF1772-domain-containing protein n=1 Tax=Venturia inaequalis TaxID=5025 RepID=A0A8H3ZD82_VENIN|nr:hypothetical protein EG328_004012 [Venturia inaequalis]KAE9994824.1 hypothetical protein EG327_000037 [Venturia inaequalis]RDI83799.1 hypothetical protein Vi05172_g6156 [Venturia inaequalis]
MSTSPLLQTSVMATCIAIDFFLSGNAVTQSFMTLPAMIIDFPSPSSPEYASRALLLGKEWPLCWTVGNVVFRPISTISTIGYAFSAWSLYRSSSTNVLEKKDWRVFALGALLHVSVIVHSAVNMQPLNDQLAALAGTGTDGKGKALTSTTKQVEGKAVEIATKWIRGNYYRLAVPMVSGALSLYQAMFL